MQRWEFVLGLGMLLGAATACGQTNDAIAVASTNGSSVEMDPRWKQYPPDSPTFSGRRRYVYSQYEGELVFKLINAERKDRGLQPLIREERMDTAALRHSMDMSTRNFVRHEGFDGSEGDDRLRTAGVTFNRWTEVVGFQSKSDLKAGERMIAEWVNAPDNQKALFNPKFKRIGVGADSFNEKAYFTAVFAE